MRLKTIQTAPIEQHRGCKMLLLAAILIVFFAVPPGRRTKATVGASPKRGWIYGNILRVRGGRSVVKDKKKKSTDDATNHMQVVTLRGSGSYKHPNPLIETVKPKRFNTPGGLAVHPVDPGVLYVVNIGTHQLFKIIDEKNIKIAGTGLMGCVDGPRDDADFAYPCDVCIEGKDWIYVSQPLNHTIRRISQHNGTVDTYVGKTDKPGFINGEIRNVRLCQPHALTLSKSGELVIADSGSHLIRKVSKAEGEQRAFVYPLAMGPYAEDTKYVDFFEHRREILKQTDGKDKRTRLYFSPMWTIYDEVYNRTEKVATGLTPLSLDENKKRVEVHGVGVDPNDNIFFLDPNRGQLRRLNADGSQVTLKSQFNRPQGLCTDQKGNVYVADTFNHRIRKVTPTGKVSTFAGQTEEQGNQDGPALFAKFNHPMHVAADPRTGDIYVSDIQNHAIRKIYNVTAHNERKRLAKIAKNRAKKLKKMQKKRKKRRRSSSSGSESSSSSYSSSSSDSGSGSDSSSSYSSSSSSGSGSDSGSGSAATKNKGSAAK